MTWNDTNNIAVELWELRTEIKYLSRTLEKMEKVFENMQVLMEKQNVANKRILDLEKEDEKHLSVIKELDTRIRKLENWKVQSITLASIIATIFGFILNKII